MNQPPKDRLGAAVTVKGGGDPGLVRDHQGRWLAEGGAAVERRMNEVRVRAAAAPPTDPAARTRLPPEQPDAR